jgi:hypothetical protein
MYIKTKKDVHRNEKRCTSKIKKMYIKIKKDVYQKEKSKATTAKQ